MGQMRLVRGNPVGLRNQKQETLQIQRLRL